MKRRVVLCVAMTALLVVAARTGAGHGTSLEILPPQFRLQPGETVHYTVVRVTAAGKREFVESFRIESNDTRVVRIGEASGFVHAMSNGRARLHFIADDADALIDVDV